MAHPSQETVTRLLHDLRSGNRSALGELFTLVYEELHIRAKRQRERWQGDLTLNTTALVHEAYLKLVDQTEAEWESRVHFLRAAAKAMRHILVDYARRRRAEKRGGNVQKLSLEEVKKTLEETVLAEEQGEALVVLDRALQRLEQVSERESQIVECRFFGGMTVQETAITLGISPTTVKRDWAMAQAWLYREMQQELRR